MPFAILLILHSIHSQSELPWFKFLIHDLRAFQVHDTRHKHRTWLTVTSCELPHEAKSACPDQLPHNADVIF